MKVVTPAQMNEIDRIAIKDFGIPGLILMENAALKVVEEIVRSLGSVANKSIILLAGKGNNGGDAFAAARHLFISGARIKVYIAANSRDITGDAAINLNIVTKMGICTVDLTEDCQLEYFESDIIKADMVVDGIFGTGLRGEVRGTAAQIITIVNLSGTPVVSIDIPSGLCGSTGKASNVCIKAVKTVTFGFPKPGLLTCHGCELTGELIVADIGIPHMALEQVSSGMHQIDGELVSSLIPQRRSNTNKGDYGKVLIISGSPGMTGSGCLAASAALRSGAGLVYLGVPASLAMAYTAGTIEAVKVPLEDNGTGFLAYSGIDKILEVARGKDVMALGPGLSLNTDIISVVRSIAKNVEIPLILDADALNAIAEDVSMLKNLKSDAVITPHPGEMARLLGVSIAEVQENRIESAREFSKRWKITTVLKGAGTVVALPDGTIYINSTGNSGMATAGTGDVLTGMVSSLAGQGMKLTDAAIAGVYIHGLAGDFAAREKGRHGMIASDLVEKIPNAMKQLLSID